MSPSPSDSPDTAPSRHSPRRGPWALGRHLRAGLSGERAERGAVALVVYVALLLLGGGLSWAIGFRVYDVQSARVATLAATASALAFTFGAALLVAVLFRPAEPPVSREANVLRSRATYAVLFAAAADGLVATSATLRAHTSPAAALSAGLEAFAFLVLPIALLVAPAAALLARPGARVLWRHLRVGLSGERPEAESAAVVLYTIALCGGALLSWHLGVRVSETQPAGIAVLVSAACAVASATLGATLVTLAAHPAAWVIARIARPGASSASMEALLAASVGVLTLYLLLPPSHAFAPAAALVGCAVGPLLSPAGSRLLRLPTAALAVGAMAVTGASALAFSHLPDAARLGVLGRAPYAAIAITMARTPFDHDHDGYSPVLAGGDCDDGNARIHPGAVDVPDNHVDENCSGADAHPYEPLPQAAARDPRAPPMRENVVLIHVEALRPDHVGFIGYRRPTTPRIDAFRNGATWFANAYAPAPTTRFALSMLFTGREIERIPQARGHAVDFTLLPEAVTLAEQLEPLGYDRVGYTLTYVIQHIKGLEQGFRIWETPWPVGDWEAAYKTTALQTTNAAIKYLDGAPQDGSRPFLLFLHYMSTHDPYIKHPGWEYGDGDMDRYDSALSYQDFQLGRLFDALDARADKEKTTIILYSDHGELFGEHGYARHGFTLYQPDVRVLLLVRVPGGHVSTIETPMLLSDIAPTVVELTGLPPDPECQTWSLLPYLLEGAPLPPRPLFLYSDQWRTGVHYVSRGVLDVDGRTKFIRNVSAGTRELYDIQADPDELTNLADARPQERDRLSEMIDGWESFENRDNKSFETENAENKTKQAKLPLPKF